MGFGILTVGYYITYLVGMLWQSEIWGALLILLGCVTITAGLLRLSEYERSFRNALFFGVVLILPAIYRVLFWLSENLLWNTAVFSGFVWSVVQITEFLLFAMEWPSKTKGTPGNSAMVSRSRRYVSSTAANQPPVK